MNILAIEKASLIPDLYPNRDIAMDNDEIRSIFINDSHFNNEFTVQSLSHQEAEKIMPPIGDRLTVMSIYEIYGDDDMTELVNFKIKNFDHKRIVLMIDNQLIDGYHHLIAAIKAKHAIKFIDLSEF